MPKNLSETTLTFLSNSGWSHGRTVDAAPFLKSLLDDDYHIFPAAEEFFSEYGGLSGLMPAYKAGSLEEFHFFPEKAISSIYRERVQDYEGRVGEPLVVVGEIHNRNMVLLLSQSGRLYGAVDDFLCMFGSSIDEGLMAIFESKEAINVQ